MQKIISHTEYFALGKSKNETPGRRHSNNSEREIKILKEWNVGKAGGKKTNYR